MKPLSLWFVVPFTHSLKHFANSLSARLNKITQQENYFCCNSLERNISFFEESRNLSRQVFCRNIRSHTIFWITSFKPGLFRHVSLRGYWHLCTKICSDSLGMYIVQITFFGFPYLRISMYITVATKSKFPAKNWNGFFKSDQMIIKKLP